MVFKPFYRYETGCAAYVFGCGGHGLGAAVDPHEQDVEVYPEFARSKGMRITHVIDTHVHADHRSGGRAPGGAQPGPATACTARRTWRSRSSRSTTGRRSSWATPASASSTRPDTRRRASASSSPTSDAGPSPGSCSPATRCSSGQWAGPICPGDAARTPRSFTAAFTAKLLALPETLEIYPAHFAGSACGAGMSGKPSSDPRVREALEPGALAPARRVRDPYLGEGIPHKPAGMEAILRFNQGRAP